MCRIVKYGIWNVNTPKIEAVNALTRCGYSPLTAMVLSSRGIESPRQAQSYLDVNAPLCDPYLMTDMDRAVQRVALALERGEKIAVFGDYDVDGITATSLLTHFLRSLGADCVPYIPGRLEEGYGLNPMAIHQLAEEGVKLIITVDCGITAVQESQLIKSLGMELVITDHHECKDVLPDAVAVVDPHRPGDRYPHKNLSGVGVAFKLACALHGDSLAVLAEYADMVCLGTVADVMLLQGENRVFVHRGLQSLQTTHRPGLAALIKECGCEMRSVNASTIGFMLAPRINAAGRMGQIHIALELFLTTDPAAGERAAKALCELNRQRQSVESEIYDQAIAMLPPGKAPSAIVLADDSWHQGVVGIVASRIAEEYCCPTFLICLDGEHGKASSRSFGGFNLFSSLTTLSPLLESYGGHELAAGFTISRQQIVPFRQEICRLAAEFYQDETPRTSLAIDCAIGPELMNFSCVEALSALEPCGNGCPKPVLMMERLTVERIRMVGSGRHMRLRLRRGSFAVNAIWFSTTPQVAGIAPGDLVDVAFLPQINEFRGEKDLQMNVLDMRPSCAAECSHEIARYQALRRGTLEAPAAAVLLPDRSMLGMVWRYLSALESPTLSEDPMCLCRKIVRWTNHPLRLEQLLVCLDIFSDVGLLELERLHKYITIHLTPKPGKADLNASQTMQTLLHLKES